jgi:hypothetical protein
MPEKPDAPHVLSPSIYLEEAEANAYRQHSDSIYMTINPKDPLEEMWVQDVVDHSWEVRRLRKIKQKLVDSSLYKGLEKILLPIVGILAAPSLSNGWQAKKPDDIEQVKKHLENAGLDMDMVRAETIALRIPEIEKIDRYLHSAELRRDKALNDIDCFRAGFRDRLKSENNKVIEATVIGEDVKLLESASV